MRRSPLKAAPVSWQDSRRGPGSRRRVFLRGVAARLTAMSLFKIGLALVVLLAGGTAAAIIHHGAVLRRQAASEGITLEKLTGLDQFLAAQGTYGVSFTYVVHEPFIGLTGESIHVSGQGTDNAYVGFAGLTSADVMRSGNSVLVLLPAPRIGPAAMDLSKTTLTEHRDLLTIAGDVFKADPGGAQDALNAAQQKIRADARNGQLASTAEAQTRTFLTTFLSKLGYTHISVMFT